MAEHRINKVHFIGIGGVGMSGIARVAKEKGMEVSGSDLRESRYTQQLREAGVKIFIGQSASNLEGLDPDVVVVSTAILENNAEFIEAKKRNLPIWHRAKMLAALGVGHDTLAVAGTHGKTTTSSMLASTLDAMGFDPTFLIGGIVRAYGSNAHCGKGEYYVVEADESDKSFTYLDPTSVLVTNIEADHLDHYSGLAISWARFMKMAAAWYAVKMPAWWKPLRKRVGRCLPTVSPRDATRLFPSTKRMGCPSPLPLRCPMAPRFPAA